MSDNIMDTPLTAEQYALLEKAFEADAANPLSPAQLHGITTGAVIIAIVPDVDRLFSELISLYPIVQGYREFVQTMYTHIHRALSDNDLAFQLFLPTDEAPLWKRAEALSKWCDGFLYGLGFTGDWWMQSLSNDSLDAITRCAELARLKFESLTCQEADEQAFIEVYEYLRMAILMLFTEIQIGSAQSSHAPEGVTIH